MPESFRNLDTTTSQFERRKAMDELKEQKKYRYVNLETLYKKMLTVLSRDIDRLMVKSFTEALNYQESQSLVQYLKLSNDLIKQQRQALKDLSSEELAQQEVKTDQTDDEDV